MTINKNHITDDCICMSCVTLNSSAGADLDGDVIRCVNCGTSFVIYFDFKTLTWKSPVYKERYN